MPRVELTGKVVVVPAEWAPAAELARRLAGQGATVVVVGRDGEEAGRLAAAIEAPAPGAPGAGRPAVFVADGSAASLDALAAFVAEMFREP